MNWTQVQSSNIRAVKWDSDTLYVEFHHGGVYAYDGVPRDLFDELLAAPSVGKFLNSEVKGKFAYRPLTADMED